MTYIFVTLCIKQFSYSTNTVWLIIRVFSQLSQKLSVSSVISVKVFIHCVIVFLVVVFNFNFLVDLYEDDDDNEIIQFLNYRRRLYTVHTTIAVVRQVNRLEKNLWLVFFPCFFAIVQQTHTYTQTNPLTSSFLGFIYTVLSR